jgi:hypothetical protein
LAVATQIHAADFDAGLAELQATDPLTRSATQIAFCGSAYCVALVLSKEHQSQRTSRGSNQDSAKPLTVKRDSNLRAAA